MNAADGILRGLVCTTVTLSPLRFHYVPQFSPELFTFDTDSSKIMSHIAQLSLLNVYAFLQVASLDASLTPLVADGGGLLCSLFLSHALSLSLSLFLSVSFSIQPVVQLINGMACTGLLLMQCFTPPLLRICLPAKKMLKHIPLISQKKEAVVGWCIFVDQPKKLTSTQ